MLTTRLYILQRLTALIMAPLVLGHIAVMIYAVQDGLTASEILDRTQGNLWWTAFYGIFVAAVAIHAAIGVRVIAFETLKLKGGALAALSGGVLLMLLLLGMRAVYAVTLSGAGA
ncbi:MAG: succinate dehydrogenase [Rhizobiales bacterium]|nr:succinate dehydrogenase [Hyphomicrobiales bacterium]